MQVSVVDEGRASGSAVSEENQGNVNCSSDGGMGGIGEAISIRRHDADCAVVVTCPLANTDAFAWLPHGSAGPAVLGLPGRRGGL